MAVVGWGGEGWPHDNLDGLFGKNSSQVLNRERESGTEFSVNAKENKMKLLQKDVQPAVDKHICACGGWFRRGHIQKRTHRDKWELTLRGARQLSSGRSFPRLKKKIDLYIKQDALV